MTARLDRKGTNGMRLAGFGKLAMRRAVPVLAIAALAGCVSLSRAVPDQLITLTATRTAAAGSLADGNISDAIVVLDPDVDRLLDVTRIPVQVNDTSVAYLKNAVWAERPAREFRRLLAETIRAGTKRVVMEGSDFDTGGRTQLSGRLSEMGYDARKGAVVVRFDAVLEEKGGAVRSRRFEAEVPGVPARAEPVAQALNNAANQVAQEVADWVGG